MLAAAADGGGGAAASAVNARCARCCTSATPSSPPLHPILSPQRHGAGGDAPEPSTGTPLPSLPPSSSLRPLPASTPASRTARRRSAFRLLTELYLAGAVTETSVLVAALKDVVSGGLEGGAGKKGGGSERWGEGERRERGVPDHEALIAAVAVVVASARSARVLLGLPVPKAEEEVRGPWLLIAFLAFSELCIMPRC